MQIMEQYKKITLTETQKKLCETIKTELTKKGTKTSFSNISDQIEEFINHSSIVHISTFIGNKTETDINKLIAVYISITEEAELSQYLRSVDIDIYELYNNLVEFVKFTEEIKKELDKLARATSSSSSAKKRKYRELITQFESFSTIARLLPERIYSFILQIIDIIDIVEKSIITIDGFFRENEKRTDYNTLILDLYKPLERIDGQTTLLVVRYIIITMYKYHKERIIPTEAQSKYLHLQERPLRHFVFILTAIISHYVCRLQTIYNMNELATYHFTNFLLLCHISTNWYMGLYLFKCIPYISSQIATKYERQFSSVLLDLTTNVFGLYLYFKLTIRDSTQILSDTSFISYLKSVFREIQQSDTIKLPSIVFNQYIPSLISSLGKDTFIIHTLKSFISTTITTSDIQAIYNKSFAAKLSLICSLLFSHLNYTPNERFTDILLTVLSKNLESYSFTPHSSHYISLGRTLREILNNRENMDEMLVSLDNLLQIANIKPFEFEHNFQNLLSIIVREGEFRDEFRDEFIDTVTTFIGKSNKKSIFIYFKICIGKLFKIDDVESLMRDTIERTRIAAIHRFAKQCKQIKKTSSSTGNIERIVENARHITNQFTYQKLLQTQKSKQLTRIVQQIKQHKRRPIQSPPTPPPPPTPPTPTPPPPTPTPPPPTPTPPPPTLDSIFKTYTPEEYIHMYIYGQISEEDYSRVSNIVYEYESYILSLCISLSFLPEQEDDEQRFALWFMELSTQQKPTFIDDSYENYMMYSVFSLKYETNRTFYQYKMYIICIFLTIYPNILAFTNYMNYIYLREPQIIKLLVTFSLFRRCLSDFTKENLYCTISIILRTFIYNLSMIKPVHKELSLHYYQSIFKDPLNINISEFIPYLIEEFMNKDVEPLLRHMDNKVSHYIFERYVLPYIRDMLENMLSNPTQEIIDTIRNQIVENQVVLNLIRQNLIPGFEKWLNELLQPFVEMIQRHTTSTSISISTGSPQKKSKTRRRSKQSQQKPPQKPPQQPIFDVVAHQQQRRTTQRSFIAEFLKKYNEIIYNLEHPESQITIMEQIIKDLAENSSIPILHSIMRELHLPLASDINDCIDNIKQHISSIIEINRLSKILQTPEEKEVFFQTMEQIIEQIHSFPIYQHLTVILDISRILDSITEDLFNTDQERYKHIIKEEIFKKHYRYRDIVRDTRSSTNLRIILLEMIDKNLYKLDKYTPFLEGITNSDIKCKIIQSLDIYYNFIKSGDLDVINGILYANGLETLSKQDLDDDYILYKTAFSLLAISDREFFRQTIKPFSELQKLLSSVKEDEDRVQIDSDKKEITGFRIGMNPSLQEWISDKYSPESAFYHIFIQNRTQRRKQLIEGRKRSIINAVKDRIYNGFLFKYNKVQIIDFMNKYREILDNIQKGEENPVGITSSNYISFSDIINQHLSKFISHIKGIEREDRSRTFYIVVIQMDHKYCLDTNGHIKIQIAFEDDNVLCLYVPCIVREEDGSIKNCYEIERRENPMDDYVIKIIEIWLRKIIEEYKELRKRYGMYTRRNLSVPKIVIETKDKRRDWIRQQLV